MGKEFGGMADYLSRRALEKSYQELTVACDSTDHVLGSREGWCQFKAPAGCSATQNGCQGSNIME